MNRSGIAYTSPSGIQSNGTNLSYLPLEEVQVKVLIVDVSAKVRLQQVYSNPQDGLSARCKYMFPVPASAAVCAFSMSTSDGRTIKGVSKEKQVASEDFARALHDGQLAGLVNYVTDDIFTISIGAIPGRGTVKVELEYVMTLANDDSIDEIRFQLLQGVAERYGTPPVELETAVEPSSYTRVRITCDIQTSGRIKEIQSPSHGKEIKETKYPVGEGKYSRRRTTVRLKSQNYLERDFVLIVRASRLDTPRCFVELHKDSEQGHHTLAFQLTLVPKRTLPPIRTQEYLFVVDRSGSMQERISSAKDTLSLLLRMLPTKGSLFNIFIFDHDVGGLWPGSLEYNETTLLEATAFVSTIDVRGGTEMGNALKYVLQRRQQSLPTAVFVLTDGQVYSSEPTQIVAEAVRKSSKTSPLRVFTLGIGSGISTETCDGIAKAGNGVSLYALDTESILGKCARLLTAGRSPFVQNVTVDWGLPQENLGTPTVKFMSQTLSPKTVATTLPPTVQQAPTEVHDIHAGTRMNIYAIVLVKKISIPQRIVLRGRLDGDGTPFELPISIDEVRLAGANNGLPLLHTCAAWHLIQEHEAKRAPLPSPLLPATDDEIRKAVIIRLGEKYQLVSQHTAFVAVDFGQDDTARRRSDRSHSSRPVSPIPDGQRSVLPSTGHQSFFNSVFGFLSGIFREQVYEELFTGRSLPGSWQDPQSASEAEGDNVDGNESNDSERTFSTLSSLESCRWSDWSEPPSPALQPFSEDEQEGDLPSPKIVSRPLGPDLTSKSEHHIHPAVSTTQPLVAPPVPPQVVTLLKSQLHDGSYELNDTLRSVVGSKAIDEGKNWDVDDKVWATALSIAFMRRIAQQAGQGELINDLMEKALEYLDSTADVDIEDVIRRAAEALE